MCYAILFGQGLWLHGFRPSPDFRHLLSGELCSWWRGLRYRLAIMATLAKELALFQLSFCCGFAEIEQLAYAKNLSAAFDVIELQVISAGTAYAATAKHLYVGGLSFVVIGPAIIPVILSAGYGFLLGFW